MSEENNAVAPATETPSGASPTTPDAPDAATPAAEPDVAAPEGTDPPVEQSPEEKAKEEAALRNAKWSQKLERREAKLRQEREQFDRQKAEQAAAVEMGKAFESKKVRPIIETYAKRHGLSFEQAFNALTHETVSPDEPTIEERVGQALDAKQAEERRQAAERQQQQQQRMIQTFAVDAHKYIAGSLQTSPHEYLKSFDPQLLARVAVDTVLRGINNGDGEIPLDKVLADMNSAEKARYELHLSRLRQGDPQVQANSERENGAGQSAKHEARKGTPQTLTNSHAAQRATAPSEDDDLSDRALSKKAVAELRRIPGWH